MSDFDSTIKQLEVQIDADRKSMDRAVDAFVATAAEAIPQWWDQQVASAISRNSARAKELGIEGLKPMKESVMDIRARAPELAAEIVGDDGAWPHRTASVGNQISAFTPTGRERLHRVHKTLDEQLRIFAGVVGEVLIKFHFAAATKDTEWERKGDRVRYKYGGLDLSSEMVAAYESYVALYNELRQRLQSVSDTQAARESHEARSLWDQA